MRPDLYTQPPMKPGFGHGGAWSSGPSKLFKLLVLLAVVGGLGTAGWKKWGPSAVVAGPRGKWLHDLDEGLAAGAASGKPVLVLYTADWCPPCRGLKRGVLSDHRINAFLAREYVRVKIDLTDRRGPNNRLAAKKRIKGTPTMVVYNHRGVETQRIRGGEAVASWIRRRASR